MKRGDIWWAELPSPRGPRPVVLLSRDSAYEVRAFVTVAPVTTRMRGIAAEVRLDAADGLSRPSIVNLDSIETIPKAALRRRMGHLRATTHIAVDDAIRFALGLSR